MVAVAEIAIIVTAVGWFVSPNITTIMEVARSYAGSRYKLSKGMKKKLQKLAQDLGMIKGYLHPGSMGFVNDTTWLDRLWFLKDAIHDAEEILDLIESHILSARNGGASSSRKSAESLRIGTNRGPSLDQVDKLLKSLGELCNIAKELRQDKNVLSRISREGMGSMPVREKKLFFGYREEYEQLVSMLGDGNEDKKVIAIIGHGGMGKTELARQAFRDVKGDFILLIWVPAYDKNTQFDLLAEIWKSAVGEESVEKMNISSLQKKLEKFLESKKCLLVLDDVWSDEEAINENQRKSVLRCITDLVAAGSRIVMTTRSKICSMRLGAEETIVLDGIGLTEVTLLLNDTAKLDGDSPIQKVLHKHLPKLLGSPLAAIEIGDEFIKHKQREQAEAAYHKGCCEILRDVENHMYGVLSGHLFTYRHLPPHLQRCFSFCSVFPSSSRFRREKLTRMWMALGFVEDDNTAGGKGSMEDIARGYFDSLVDRSLFQKREAKAEGDNQTYYVIHEHIHLMIRWASAKNCLIISGDTGHCAGPSKTNIPATVRHLSVTSDCLHQLKEYRIRLSRLRTLLILKNSKDPANLISGIDKDILEQFEGVRVLDLTETAITQLPENIGKLEHVRYLGLHDTINSDLCDQVTRLLFLETLRVGDKRNNKEKKRKCIASISGIGRLVKLRESIEFKVKGSSTKEGHGVAELAGMNSLRGTLSIKGVDAVASKKEAEEACLTKKVDVKVLKLEWETPEDGSAGPAAAKLSLDVLTGLRPHNDLQELRITRYNGVTLPKWLSKLKKLTRLYLSNCRNLQALPAVGGLPCLEFLNIKELDSVNRIGSSFCGGGEFPNLKQIVLDDMQKLVAWDKMPNGAFPHLRKVRIIDCTSLSSLSGLKYLVGLDLRIERCDGITHVNLPENFRNGKSTCKFE